MHRIIYIRCIVLFLFIIGDEISSQNQGKGHGSPFCRQAFLNHHAKTIYNNNVFIVWRSGSPKRIHKLHDGERNYRSPDVWAEARLWFKHQRDTVPEAASHLVMMASSSLHTPLIKLTTCNTKWALHSELQVHFSHDTPTLLYTTAAAQKRLGASQSCPKLF